AKEYIPLPPDPELIAAVLAAVASDARHLIYRDEAMARVVQLANQVAGSDASILITGESGTGKEVLARYVHTKSN
uniref:sigma 54-interacting transcriptional regulator n=1 Tax=Stenotrophomonas maltophilia TaxID=40324 RepID=UPI0013D9C0AC